MEVNITVNGTDLTVREGDSIIVLKYFDEEQKKPYYTVEQYRDNELIFNEGEA